VDRRKRSRKQEEAGAEKYDGKVQPGSGSHWARPHDVRTKDWLIEYKFTDAKSFTLKKGYLASLFRKAVIEERIGVLIIDIDGLVVTVMSEADANGG
jgi:hypothetical protein